MISTVLPITTGLIGKTTSVIPTRATPLGKRIHEPTHQPTEKAIVIYKEAGWLNCQTFQLYNFNDRIFVR